MQTDSQQCYGWWYPRICSEMFKAMLRTDVVNYNMKPYLPALCLLVTARAITRYRHILSNSDILNRY